MHILKDLLIYPWPWYLTGPLMGAPIPLLLFFGNKMLGASFSLRHICALIPNQIAYFNYEVKKGYWNLAFAGGVFLGGLVTYHFFYKISVVEITESTRRDLFSLGLHDLSGLMPSKIFSASKLWGFQGLLFTILGGFLVGFGVRYSMGLSQLSTSSAIAIIAFFGGGIIMTHLLLPLII